MSTKIEYSKAYNKAYYEENKEREKERAKKYYHETKDEKDKEKKRLQLKEWQAKNKDRVREYREKTKDKRNARRRELYAQDENRRIEARKKVRQWQQENKEKRKAQRLKPYQISHEEYLAMLERQNRQCPICGHSDMSNPNIFPLVDHCHKTKKVRGLLCLNCNQALGKMKDSPERLKAAIAYLETNG
jgi:ribosomal protein S27AE